MPQKTRHARWLHPLIILLAFCITVRAAIEPVIVPTVHTTLQPISAIQSPLQFFADQTSVWHAETEQRALLTGHVAVSIGYRLLNADNAAVWLTPDRESGANVYKVDIYLAGNVQVREGNLKNSTTTVGKELLVTTKVMQAVQGFTNLAAKAQEDSPIVKRGNELRDIAARPQGLPLLVPIITITTAERALQSGWIARGPNNRLIPGAGDLRDVHGNVIPGSETPTAATRPAKRPTILATGDKYEFAEVGKELVTIVPGAYLLYDSQDGKPPLEFRAQRMVLFSPNPNASTQPATSPAGTQPATQPTPKPSVEDQVAKYVTGAYLEGDVTLDEGDQLMVKAERIYYDFTTHRAIMLDATLATVDEKRDVPIYMRAAEIRQTARGEYAARDVKFSTSEFYTPHYNIGASEIYLHDITAPSVAAGPETGVQGMDLGPGGGDLEAKTFQFEVKNATIDILGTPVFYWPFLAGDTSQNEIPLRTVRVSNSRTYGLSLLTDWDLFALAGQAPPEGLRADLNIDYFGKRGPAGGVQSDWKFDDDHGVARTYAMLDDGTDRLGRDRSDITPTDRARGRATVRDQRDLGDGLTLQLEGSYISDPTFLEQFFQREFDTDKENETAVYLKKQNENDALSFLGKFNLMDFTATADQIDSQTSTEKKPEIKYWRIGDNFFDLLTYYSETSASNVRSDITNYTPAQLGILSSFLGAPGNAVPKDQTYRAYLTAHGYTTSDVLRADTRQEVDLPLQLGDFHLTPYVTGRVTFWDQDFPETPVAGGSTTGTTARYYGAAGIRASTQLWRVYEDANSTFFDVHRLRHIVEPQFNLFAAADSVDRNVFQPFDRDVEGMTGASGMQVALNQTWQTKRGGEGHWRDVDWITFNVAWNQYWNKDKTTSATSAFFPGLPVRGSYFVSRPELSLVQNSINVDGTWRVGEWARFLGDADYGIDSHHVEQYSAGIAIDQSKSLSYFFGDRYIHDLHTDQWTLAMDYQVTQKYEMIAAESFDFLEGNNILSSFTIIRKLPRFNTAITITYDANNADTTVSFTAWPEGLPNMGLGNQGSGPTAYRK